MVKRRSFKAGDVVCHSRFGLGAIEDGWGSWLDIDDKGNELMVNGAGIYEVRFEHEPKRTQFPTKAITPRQRRKGHLRREHAYALSAGLE